MITRFDDFNIPDLNSVSIEFWKMTTISNWKKVIVDYNKVQRSYIYDREKNEKCKVIKEKAAARIYKKYSYKQVKEFHNECHIMYRQLYKYFEPIWLNDKNKYGPSDDSYFDLLTSMIGSGKRFTKECINDPWNKYIEIAKNYAYVENFSYLLGIDEDEYEEIRIKYDHVYRDSKKYNL